jgi:hypothetical protein
VAISSGPPDVGVSSSTQAKLLREGAPATADCRLTWGFSIASFAATLMFLHWSDRGERADREPPGVFSANLNAAPASVETRTRPVFRHSIVPGGVRSREEVVAAMAKDVVVKAHYVSVTPAALRQVQLSAPLKVHVSYRVGNNVYWTKRPLTVAAGEFVLTDGSVTIRERCGNLLSVQPLGPTQVGEPDPDEFDMYVQPLKPSSQSVSAGSPRSGVPGSIPMWRSPRSSAWRRRRLNLVHPAARSEGDRPRRPRVRLHPDRVRRRRPRWTIRRLAARRRVPTSTALSRTTSHVCPRRIRPCRIRLGRIRLGRIRLGRIRPGRIRPGRIPRVKSPGGDPPTITELPPHVDPPGGPDNKIQECRFPFPSLRRGRSWELVWPRPDSAAT